MRAARVWAQAKINVWLHVLGPMPDGYHEIATLFQRVELADDIIVRVGDAKSRTLHSSGPRLPADGLGPDDRNLAYRAAEEFHAHTGWPRGFSIELTKHIPVGGGLGGGSADAGAVLRALNELAPERLDSDAIQAIAASLGADVPFFASEFASAIGTGRGDRLAESGVELPDATVLLAIPPFGVSTPDAYGWLREFGTYHRQPHGSSVDASHATGPTWKALDLGNTFEGVVEAHHPELRDLRARLSEAGASVARLSGSGSTVFGLFEGSAPSARDLKLDALIIPTKTASRVVQVEVLE
jgi:4-diphosphocytidyl-2-C-methyl-D-erythritol kinase